MTNDYRSTLASVCEHKRSYEPIVVNASRNTFSPNNELKITQTAITGDVFTNFNTSYIELELETNIAHTEPSFEIDVYGQPACLVSRISGDYKYIDPFTGEEVACDLSNDELHIGLYRSIVNMVYMPKSVHEQNSYLTEYPFYGVNNYTTDRTKIDRYGGDEPCFNDKIIFFKSDNKFIAKIRIPWNSLLDIGAQPYLVNVKSMNLTISWVNQEDYFDHDKPIYIKSARTVTDYYRVNSLKSLPWGEEALVRPNIFPIGQNYELLANQTRWHQSFRIPYAPKACFLFFTNPENQLVSLTPLNIDYFRCYTGSGFSNHLPQYQNIYIDDPTSPTSSSPDYIKYLPDSRFFDELMHVANPAEKHMIDYNTFTKYFRIYAVDFESSAELLASQNEIYFELRFDKTRDTDLNVHVVFIENAPDYNISVEPMHA